MERARVRHEHARPHVARLAHAEHLRGAVVGGARLLHVLHLGRDPLGSLGDGSGGARQGLHDEADRALDDAVHEPFGAALARALERLAHDACDSRGAPITERLRTEVDPSPARDRRLLKDDLSA